MCRGRVRTLGQESLEISSIIIQVCGVSYLHAIQRDGTLTEERVNEVICPRRKIRDI